MVCLFSCASFSLICRSQVHKGGEDTFSLSYNPRCGVSTRGAGGESVASAPPPSLGEHLAAV